MPKVWLRLYCCICCNNYTKCSHFAVFIIFGPLFFQIGSLFTKHDSPQAGAGPAVGGITGLALVEHVIRRRTIKNPGRRLTFLIGSLFALIFLGTLPQVNSFSLLAGLPYGCLSALVFWSRIVFPRKFFLCQFIVVFTIVMIFLFSLAL